MPARKWRDDKVRKELEGFALRKGVQHGARSWGRAGRWEPF
jgi:hypothetical protein